MEILESQEHWVQCDNRNCNKWRLLPPGEEVNGNEPWYCSMSPDLEKNTCSASEEVRKQLQSASDCSKKQHT